MAVRVRRFVAGMCAVLAAGAGGAWLIRRWRPAELWPEEQRWPPGSLVRWVDEPFADEGPNGEQLWVRPGDEGIVVADDSPISFCVSFPDAVTFVAPRSSVTLVDHVVGRREEGVSSFPDPGEDLERLQDSWSVIVEAIQEGGGTVAAAWVVEGAPRELSRTQAELRAVAPVPDGVLGLLSRVPRARLEWLLPESGIPDRRWANWGRVHWSVAEVLTAEQHRRRWIEEVFARPDDPYDAVWQGAFGLMVLPNDDVIGVEVSSGHVVYLSHDDDEAHGALLGTTVIDFVRRWTWMGCPGPDGLPWEQFTGAEGIEVDAGPVARWLDWLTSSYGPRSS